MNKCSWTFALVLIGLSTSLFAQNPKIRILSRNTTDGGILGFEETSRTRWVDAAGVAHVDITCRNPGSKFPPQQVNGYDNDLTRDYSAAEINLMQQWLNLAVNSIGQNNLTGKRSQRLQVYAADGSGHLYLYELTWQAIDPHGTTSRIEITRQEL